MRILVRLALLCAALLSVASVASADRSDRADRPGKPDKGQAEKPDQAGKPDKGRKGEDGKQGEDTTSEPESLAPQDTAPAALVYPDEPTHPELTTFAEDIGAAPTSGSVLVKLPGSEAFTPLAEARSIPVGSVVDATGGLVEIMSEAAPDGTEQNAVVTGGVFRVGQNRASGVTDLKLQGGDFSACKDASDEDDDDAVVARAAAKRKRKGGQVARGIWAAGKGRFRTSGRHSAATVRGTRWATVDRCLSTTTKVWDGIVDVKHFGTGRTVAVRAGERHVAREPRS